MIFNYSRNFIKYKLIIIKYKFIYNLLSTQNFNIVQKLNYYFETIEFNIKIIIQFLNE